MNAVLEGSRQVEVLKVENLEKKDILHGINFSVEEGEMVAIMGPSGSGKSTLLYCVSGMCNTDGGTVTLMDRQINMISEDEKSDIRLHEMGFVFQQMNVIKNLNIIDNIILPVSNGRRHRVKEQYSHALELMKQYHIDELAQKEVHEVSGGQLQRACIVRSLMNNPKIIFADEPTGALNKAASREVVDSFLQINASNTTILMVTHDYQIAAKCERILYIIDGRLVGTLALGKYDEKTENIREKQVLEWLEQQGW